MGGNPRARAFSHLLVGALVVAPAAAAHAAAGGRVSVAGTAAALVGGLSLAFWGGAHLRWTLTRLLLVALAAQPLLHSLLGGAGHGPDHLHGPAGGPQVAGTVGAAVPMWVVHAALGVATAVLVNSGWRWLRLMPALARAIALAVQRAAGAAAPTPARRFTTTVATDGGRRVAWARSSRGPPR